MHIAFSNIHAAAASGGGGGREPVTKNHYVHTRVLLLLHTRARAKNTHIRASIYINSIHAGGIHFGWLEADGRGGGAAGIMYVLGHKGTTRPLFVFAL
jgi:hypothetical protein